MTSIEEITRSHGTLIARIVRSYEASPPLAEDLRQEIYLAIWLALPKFRNEASLRTFVARVAHNRAISYVIRAAREPRREVLDPELPSTAPSPEEVLVSGDRRAKLEAAVQSLPVGQKIVMTLALEGFTPDEAAEVLGISATNASVRLHRAKSALTKLMKEKT